MENLEIFECYDHLLFEPMGKYGWEITEVPWRNESVNWDAYDAVIIRSPWDYQDDPDHFIHVLERIDRSSARLENPLQTVQWNLDKRYLRDMQTKGIPIVPTHFRKSLQPGKLASFFDLFDAQQIIIKPVISANADHTYRISPAPESSLRQEIEEEFSQRPLMIQPFMDAIITEGEFSLFYFGGKFSHAILKTPADDDFRVQEEHGGTLKRIEPDEQLRAVSNRTMQALPEVPLYARIDYVRGIETPYALMEIELIEPSLYFNMDEESPARFAREFNRWIDE